MKLVRHSLLVVGGELSGKSLNGDENWKSKKMKNVILSFSTQLTRRAFVRSLCVYYTSTSIKIKLWSLLLL